MDWSDSWAAATCSHANIRFFDSSNELTAIAKREPFSLTVMVLADGGRLMTVLHVTSTSQMPDPESPRRNCVAKFIVKFVDLTLAS
jgi:hypothetical protein